MKIYLVGGAVRDHVLKLNNSHDKDWVVVGGNAEFFLVNGYQQVGKDFPVFLHPKTNEEYALARIERKIGSKHTDFHCIFDPNVTLEEDLSRRDLTINAMAMDEQKKIIDPFNGLSDCKNKILRHVSAAFVEDPLRCLRIARFAAQLTGFMVAHETMQLCQQMISENALDNLSHERIWLEWQKALLCSDPNQFFSVLSEMGAINQQIQLTYHKLPAESDIRFALFACNCPEYDKVMLTVAPPKDHQKLVVIIRLIQTKAKPKTAKDFLEVLIITDAFRRPEIFDKFLLIANISPTFKHWHNTLLILPKVLDTANEVKPNDIISQGFEGKAISEQMNKMRLQKIAKILKQQ